MEKLTFAPMWQEYFHPHGLRTFADFFEGTEGLSVNKNSKRDVTRLALDGNGPRVLFVKRFHRPHIKDVLAGLRQSGRFTSQAALEWHNATYLLQHGIGTYHPVCYGEQSTLGFERRSFLITEALDAACLLDLVMDRWDSMDRSARERVVVEMARLAGRVHDLNVSLPDLQVWHIFLDPAVLDRGDKFCVIDLHRMKRNVTRVSEKVRDIARLRWSMSSRYFDDGLKDLLVSTYADAVGVDADFIAGAVARRVRKLDSRRSPDRYYRRTTVESF